MIPTIEYLLSCKDFLEQKQAKSYFLDYVPNDKCDYLF